MKRYNNLIVGIIILLMLVACGEQTSPTEISTPTEETKVLKVGVLAPLSGKSKSTGIDIKNAAIMAFEEVDYKVGNYTIELEWIDSKSDPEYAAQEYEKAIEEKGIQVGILNWHSSVSVSVMDIATDHEIPHFFGIGATQLINEKFHSNDKPNYWNFKGWPTPNKLSQNYVDTLESAIADGLWQPSEKRAALFVEDTDWGHNFALNIKTQLEKEDWLITPTHYLIPTQTEFLPLLQEIQNEPTSLLVATGASEDFMPSFINQVDELELSCMVVADGLGWTGGWYEKTGNASDYVIDQIPSWTTEKGEEFAKKFEEKYGNSPSPSSAGLSYDYTNFFIEILKATEKEYGELNSLNLYLFGQEQVQTGNFTYKDGIVMKEYKYTPDTVPDPVVGENYYTFPVIQYFQGEGVVIWPSDWQEAKLKAKKP